MFETVIPRYPLPTLTDEYAVKVGQPDVCGPRTYRFVYPSDGGGFAEQNTWMLIDELTHEYWIDFQDPNHDSSTIRLYLEVGLEDYPDVVKMY